MYHAGIIATFDPGISECRIMESVRRLNQAIWFPEDMQNHCLNNKAFKFKYIKFIGSGPHIPNLNHQLSCRPNALDRSLHFCITL